MELPSEEVYQLDGISQQNVLIELNTTRHLLRCMPRVVLLWQHNQRSQLHAGKEHVWKVQRIRQTITASLSGRAE